jgi:arylsulfatase A-like enzyme
MMGLYPSQLGVRSNGDGLYHEDKLPSVPLPEIFRREGYQTAGFGKAHWNHFHPKYNPKPSKRGFEVRVSPCDREEGNMGYLNFEGMEAYNREVKDFGPGEENANGYRGLTSNVPEKHHRDGFTAQKCLEFLDDGIDPERPLFLYLSFIKPHAGFNVIKKYEDIYSINDIPDIPQPEWGEEPDTHVKSLFENSPFLKDRYDAWHLVWDKLSREEKKWTTLRYWANISWLDNYIGEVINKLEKMGRLENSLIVFLSDHGEMLGERNHLFGKYCLYDSSVRVPLILAGSSIPEKKRGTIDERPVELVDIIPTLTNAVGIKKNPILPGHDLLGDCIRKGSFSELHGGGILNEPVQPAPAYMWRNKDWKLILYFAGTINNASQNSSQVKGELYDLMQDPHEHHNLYCNSTYGDIREQMKTELLMHLAVAWAKGPVYNHSKGVERLVPENKE